MMVIQLFIMVIYIIDVCIISIKERGFLFLLVFYVVGGGIGLDPIDSTFN